MHRLMVPAANGRQVLKSVLAAQRDRFKVMDVQPSCLSAGFSQTRNINAPILIAQDDLMPNFRWNFFPMSYQHVDSFFRTFESMLAQQSLSRATGVHESITNADGGWRLIAHSPQPTAHSPQSTVHIQKPHQTNFD